MQIGSSAVLYNSSETATFQTQAADLPSADSGGVQPAGEEQAIGGKFSLCMPNEPASHAAHRQSSPADAPCEGDQQPAPLLQAYAEHLAAAERPADDALAVPNR